MSNKITFVDNGDSFIIRSLIQELCAYDIEGSSIKYSVKEIEDNKNNLGSVVAAYIDYPEEIDTAAMIFLRDICIQQNIALVAIGKETDISEIKNSTSISSIAEEFYRPVNVKEVAGKLSKYFESDSQMTKYHILVVDDSGMMLRTLQEWLGGKYRVSVVNSAMNAINFLEKFVPDLILLDYEMPGCSGAQLLEMLRADLRTEKIPVIFLTGKDDKASVQQVLRLKPEGYLLKNMPKEYILEQIDAFFMKLKASEL